MQPFQPAVQDRVTWQELRKKLWKTHKNFTPTDWQAQADLMNSSEVYLNDIYQVHKQYHDLPGSPCRVIHLSVKRRDGGAVHDWRHMQQIKNELAGPECEGIELYPAESRLHDAANQFHMWVMEDDEFRFPFGFPDRVVKDGTGVKDEIGCTQRPFEKRDIPETRV